MSVGGYVIETIDTGKHVWIDTKEKEYYHSSTAIYVERTPEALSISPGDTVWWQGAFAYWTAKSQTGKTVGKPATKLKRIGCSGVSRPKPNAETGEK